MGLCGGVCGGDRCMGCAVAGVRGWVRDVRTVQWVRACQNALSIDARLVSSAARLVSVRSACTLSICGSPSAVHPSSALRVSASSHMACREQVATIHNTHYQHRACRLAAYIDYC